MGKAKKLRSTSHKKRIPPTGGASIAEMEQMQDEHMNGNNEDAHFVKGLTALEGSVREATCVTLAGMFGDSASEQSEERNRQRLQRMVERGLLQKLIPRVVDPLKMVRLHALGALRNISVTGGIDVCEDMTKHNVITPLIRVITENATDETFAKDDLHAVQVLEQAIALLTNLCESCEAAINELTRGNLVSPIMLIAERAKAHGSLQLETLRLLLSITESNPVLSKLFSDNASYQVILGEIITAEQVSLYVKLHAIGVAMNIESIVATSENVGRMLPVLEAALAYDAVNVVQMAQQAVAHWELSHKSFEETETMEEDGLTEEKEQEITAAQAKVRAWKDSVQTLAFALELSAQLGAMGDDGDDVEEWGSDDEDAMEEYATSQMETDGQAASCASSPALKALSESKVALHCATILQGLVSVPAIGVRSIELDFERMRIRVCNALNNLVQSMPSSVMDGSLLTQLFCNLCTLYNNIQSGKANQAFDFENVSSTNDIEVATTAAMWAVLRRAGTDKYELPITPDQANLIMQKALQSPSKETRVNAVGMVGCVGRRTRDMAENRIVGQCLLQSLRDTSLEVVAEVLNALFDVFGDEDFDANFKELNFLPHLEETAKSMRSKLRAEQRTMDRETVAHIKETQLNLVRFIKYKKQHL